MSRFVRYPVRRVLLAAALLGVPLPVLAGEAATIVFRSGQVVRINDGYTTVVAAMSKLNASSQAHSIVNLNIGGGSFLLNVAEAVIVCRDHCPSLEVVDVRDPARTPTR